MTDLLFASFRLEAIADNTVAHSQLVGRVADIVSPGLGRYFDSGAPRPWVARLTGACPRYGFQRAFIRGRKDYADSNSVGSRGIYIYYELPAGVYEVNDLVSWGRRERYFIRVSEGQWTKISKEEARLLVESGGGGPG